MKYLTMNIATPSFSDIAIPSFSIIKLKSCSHVQMRNIYFTDGSLYMSYVSSGMD